MSYDYNSQDSRFDLPNPYKIENIFTFCASAALILGGIALLFIARGSLSSGSLVAMLPLAIGVALLVDGLKSGSSALSRLRFFFGRGQPEDMAPQLASDAVGSSHQAEEIKNLLRHSSLAFQEPKGPINGLLYSLFPNLIFSPQFIQNVAKHQFRNALAFGVSILALAVSAIGSSHETAGWIGLFYFAFALFVLFRNIDINAAPGETDLGFLMFQILLAILGPVAIPMLAKGAAAPDWFPGMWQAGIVMVMAEIAIVLFFKAAVSQMVEAPPVATSSVVQGTLTMNSHPKQVLDELERQMQDQWVASLPNRRYARLTPDIELNTQSGSFEGELLEETQPVLNSEIKSITLQSCFNEPHYSWLAYLNSYGVSMVVFAVIAMTVFGSKFYTTEGINTSIFTFATLGISLWSLGRHAFRVGHYLWGRFDFVSKLIWVEMKGNYQAAQVDYGNQFTDRMKTQKQVINIESMTFRVWMAEIETATFGKDCPRPHLSILGMRGLKDEAQALHDHLTEFGKRQSMIVAPTSSNDLERASALGAMNKLSGELPQATKALPGAIADAITEAAHAEEDTVQTEGNTCQGCQPAAAIGAKFCPDCGSKLATLTP